MASNTGGIFGGGGFGGDPLAGAGGVVPIGGGIFTGGRQPNTSSPGTPIGGGTVFVPIIPGGDNPGTTGSRSPTDTVNPPVLEEKPGGAASEKEGRPWLKWALIGAAVLAVVVLVKD